MTPRLIEYAAQCKARREVEVTSPREKNWNHAFFNLYADLPLAERQARSYAYSLENEPVLLRPIERLACQIYQACAGSGCVELGGSELEPRWEDYSVGAAFQKQYDLEFPANDSYRRFGHLAAPGHVCWDFGRILKLGVSGMIRLCQEKSSETNDPKSQEFYRCVILTLEGLISWGRKHVEALRIAIAEETDPQRKTELLEMAAICEKVPAQPATTFREAVQSFLFQHNAVMFENPFGGNGPGRMDYYLWPYLQADLDADRISLEEARELLTECLIKLDERIGKADGWVEAVPVGGRKPDGSSSINLLSYMIIESIIELKQTHPSVYVRLHDGAPDDFVDLCVRYILEGENRAQIYGDDAMIAALHADGVALEDARHWTAGGCMEVSPQACNCDLLFAFVFNVTKTFEWVINGGRNLQDDTPVLPHLKTLPEYSSFDELYETFSNELEKAIGYLMRALDLSLDCYAKYRPSFLLSSMTHDCLEKGRGINDGGARYMIYGGSGMSIPNVGDSLYAIKKAIFDEGSVGAEELLAALRVDFEGYEALRLKMQGLPKFGQDNPEPDEMVNRVLMTFTNYLRSHRNQYGGHCKPVILAFVWAAQFGLELGATPDGRHSKRPLAHGLAPQSGAAIKGITAAINSATSLSLREIGGGSGMMWDLDPAWAKPETVKPILQTFIERGGQIFQGNTTSVDQLIAAQQDPDQYRDLIVRVGGYSARFCLLSKELQDDIIQRRRYAG